MIGYALLGGVLVGLAASLLLLFNGRIMGASGIAGVLSAAIAARVTSSKYAKKEIFWRAMFILGLLFGGFIINHFFNDAFRPQKSTAPHFQLIISGLLVGIGTRMGWGCTSGHGVCGMARLSGRSLVSTIVFIGSGVITLLLKRFL